VAFTPKNWEDAPSNNTPISAAALEDMEIRTTNYSDGLFSIATRTSPIDAESYGVDGLGGDQSSALAAAMAAAATADRELQLPEGVIRINTKINMTNTVVRMRGHGPSNTIFEHNCPSEMLVFRGTLGTGTLLTANASAGAVSVVVTSASGITVGSRGIVRSTTAWPFTDKGAKKGELVRVVGVSGTTLTLAWPLEDDYVTADAAIFEPRWLKGRNCPTFRSTMSAPADRERAHLTASGSYSSIAKIREWNASQPGTWTTPAFKCGRASAE
jgi:hypothetical protein